MRKPGFEPEGILPVVPPIVKKVMQFFLRLLPILSATVYIPDTQTHLIQFPAWFQLSQTVRPPHVKDDALFFPKALLS